MVYALDTTAGPMTLYPKSGLVMCEGRLYRENTLNRSSNERNIANYLKNGNPNALVSAMFFGGDLLFTPKYLLVMKLPILYHFGDSGIRYSQEGPSKRPAHMKPYFFDSLNPAVKLLQETMRRIARQRMRARARRLAVLMAVHDRLGTASPLQLLEPALLQLVCAGV